MKLEKIYDKKDTQAILVSNKDFLVLAFRGTETNSIKDIKTDLKAKLIHYKTNSRGRGVLLVNSFMFLFAWQS